MFSFKLPRRSREPYDDTRRVTTQNLNEMENRVMAALEEAVAALNQAIQEANSRFQVASDVESAVAAEREKYDALVAEEDAEDVLQNQELQDARAQTDAAVAQLNAAADSVRAAADQVNNLGNITAAQSTNENDANSTDAAGNPVGASGTTSDTPDSASTEDAGGDTTAEVSPTTDTTPSENPTDAAPADTPTAGDVMRSDEQAQESDPTSTRNMEPNV